MEDSRRTQSASGWARVSWSRSSCANRRRGREAFGVRPLKRRFPNTVIGDVPRKAVLKHAHSKRFAPSGPLVATSLCELDGRFTRLRLTRMRRRGRTLRYAFRSSPACEISRLGPLRPHGCRCNPRSKARNSSCIPGRQAAVVLPPAGACAAAAQPTVNRRLTAREVTPAAHGLRKTQ